jgi:hypothetical protein
VTTRLVGNASASLTLGTYSHAVPAMQEEAATLIAWLVFANEQVKGLGQAEEES